MGRSGGVESQGGGQEWRSGESGRWAGVEEWRVREVGRSRGVESQGGGQE